MKIFGKQPSEITRPIGLIVNWAIDHSVQLGITLFMLLCLCPLIATFPIFFSFVGLLVFIVWLCFLASQGLFDDKNQEEER